MTPEDRQRLREWLRQQPAEVGGMETLAGMTGRLLDALEAAEAKLAAVEEAAHRLAREVTSATEEAFGEFWEMLDDDFGVSGPSNVTEAHGDHSDPRGREKAVSGAPRALCEDGES